MLTWADDAPQFLRPDERELLARKAARRDEARKRREEREAKDRWWQERFDFWGLTNFESRLFRAIEYGPCGPSEERFTVLHKVYGVSLSEKSEEKEQRRYFARLRKLQQRLNNKLRLARAPYKVEPCHEDLLRIVDTDAEEKEGSATSKPVAPMKDDEDDTRRDELLPNLSWNDYLSMSVTECEQRLRTILANGPVATWKVKQELTNEGCRARTLKRARKRLGVVAQREGYGGNGEWLLSLPGQ